MIVKIYRLLPEDYVFFCWILSFVVRAYVSGLQERLLL